MNMDIQKYNLSLSEIDQIICSLLMNEIDGNFPEMVSKIWHGSPVWFLDDNPIVGYCKLKNHVQLLFWSGQTFNEEGLKSVGKYKAAEVWYTNPDEINVDQLKRWLIKSIEIQWDYKNVAKRKGVLQRLK
ncbi:MAG: DUF1801 domain-containing protein [Clostridia bacterium]